MSPQPPIRRQVLVDADPATAFTVFTASLGQWWPLAELSVFGAGATVSFTGQQIVETAGNGDTSVWGTVSSWQAPDVVAFSWHPGRTAEQASQVEVTFAAAGEKTLVTLTHTGWEAYEDPAAARAEYGSGWLTVLGLFKTAADADDHAGEDDGPAQTWVALLHRPGPEAPVGGSLFADPRFGEHLAFLNRMREAGLLVAAGPFGDEPGAGMTVLRLPGADQFAEATRLATEDDTSVASQFLTVTVRPWNVMSAS